MCVHIYRICIQFDFSMFHSTALVRPAMAGGGNKYPDILPNYQAEGTPDLYFGEIRYMYEDIYVYIHNIYIYIYICIYT